jgi:hypothetical protein
VPSARLLSWRAPGAMGFQRLISEEESGSKG